VRRAFPAAQLLRFASVGVLATLVHSALYVLFVDAMRATPAAANLIAFGVAVIISYLGHARWTFRDEYSGRDGAAYPVFARFVTTALLGLALNSLFVFLVVDAMGWNYLWAVPFFVFVTPLFVYLTSKFWVFA
jgi:putative flippase GtrA